MEDFAISKVNEKGGTTLPEEVRKEMQVDGGGYIKWIKKGDKSFSVIKVTAILIIIAGCLFSVPAFAQEAPTDPLASVPTKVFHGPTAWLPLRIELTYPSTTSLIQNVTKSPLTVTNINTLDGVNGLATTPFSTGMSDSFDI